MLSHTPFTMGMAVLDKVLQSNRTYRPNLSLNIERGFVRVVYRLWSSYSNSDCL